jgi:hypothetical protein
MNIAKQKIVDALRARGQDIRADWVTRELPDRVEVAEHSGLISMLDIDVTELVDAESDTKA